MTQPLRYAAGFPFGKLKSRCRAPGAGRDRTPPRLRRSEVPMSLATTSVSKDFASDGLPLFLGDPNAKPDPIPPEYPWQFILEATHLIHEKYQREPWPPEDRILRSIIESAFVLGEDQFKKHFEGWKLLSGAWRENPDQAWDALRNSLRPIESIDQFTNFEAPRPERRSKKSPKALCAEPAKKTNLQDAPGREIPVRPIVDPSLKPALNPHRAKVIPIARPHQSLSSSTRLADQWKLDSRWARLTPCAIAVLYALLRRTYNAEAFKKITQAFTKGQTWFPWCLKGIESLSRKLLYTKKSNPVPKHYKSWAIKAGLRQLEELGFISTLFRGYEGQGAGKCFVFLNPKMSAAFHRESRRHKQRSTR